MTPLLARRFCLLEREAPPSVAPDEIDRFESPGIGAFTSRDSVAGQVQDPLSLNRFLYAEANPTTLVDPTGHALPERGCGPDGTYCNSGGQSNGTQKSDKKQESTNPPRIPPEKGCGPDGRGCGIDIGSEPGPTLPTTPPTDGPTGVDIHFIASIAVGPDGAPLNEADADRLFGACEIGIQSACDGVKQFRANWANDVGQLCAAQPDYCAAVAQRDVTSAALLAELILTGISGGSDVPLTGPAAAAAIAKADSLAEELEASGDSVDATIAAEGEAGLVAEDAEGPTSVWNEDPRVRGTALEPEMGGNNTGSNWETIDRLENGNAISFKSLDLAAKTYSDPAALLSRLRGYINKLSDYTGSTMGRRQITEEQITSRALRVAVPIGMTPAQEWAMSEAVQYGAGLKTNPVNLIFMVVP